MTDGIQFNIGLSCTPSQSAVHEQSVLAQIMKSSTYLVVIDVHAIIANVLAFMDEC